jgi:hypothetical protein
LPWRPRPLRVSPDGLERVLMVGLLMRDAARVVATVPPPA